MALAHRLQQERGTGGNASIRWVGSCEVVLTYCLATITVMIVIIIIILHIIFSLHRSLITRGPILPSYPPYARASLLPLAKAAGVGLLEGAGVARVEAGAVVLQDGGRVEADEVLLCTQAAAAGWLKDTGLPLGAMWARVCGALLLERCDIFRSVSPHSAF